MKALFAAVLSSCLGISACSASVGEEVRRHTYPPESRYIRRADIRRSMEVLVAHAHALDELLVRSNDQDDGARAATIVEHLRAMRSAAAAIDPGTARTNHRLLDENLAKFIGDLELAERAAEATPPSYFLAASISGSCVHCHGSGK